MSLIGNILWLIFGGGILLFFEYLIGGLLLCITIIGIPFGVQVLKLSALSLSPFGREIKTSSRADGCLYLLMNVFWLLFGGIWIALTHLIFALICAVTIIGIPFAVQHVKLAALALSPFGKYIV